MKITLPISVFVFLSFFPVASWAYNLRLQGFVRRFRQKKSISSIENEVKDAIEAKDVDEAQRIFLSVLKDTKYVGIVPPRIWLRGTAEGSGVKLERQEAYWKPDWPLMNESRTLNNFAVGKVPHIPGTEAEIDAKKVQIGVAKIKKVDERSNPPKIETTRDGQNVPFVVFIGTEGFRKRDALGTLNDAFVDVMKRGDYKGTCNTQTANRDPKLSSVVECVNLNMIMDMRHTSVYLFQPESSIRTLDIKAVRNSKNWNVSEKAVARDSIVWFRSIFDIVKYLNKLLRITKTQFIGSANEEIHEPLKSILVKEPTSKGDVLLLEIEFTYGTQEKKAVLKWNYNTRTATDGDTLAQFLNILWSQDTKGPTKGIKGENTVPTFTADGTFWMRGIVLLQKPQMRPDFFYDYDLKLFNDKR